MSNNLSKEYNFKSSLLSPRGEYIEFIGCVINKREFIKSSRLIINGERVVLSAKLLDWHSPDAVPKERRFTLHSYLSIEELKCSNFGTRSMVSMAALVECRHTIYDQLFNRQRPVRAFAHRHSSNYLKLIINFILKSKNWISHKKRASTKFIEKIFCEDSSWFTDEFIDEQSSLRDRVHSASLYHSGARSTKLNGKLIKIKFLIKNVLESRVGTNEE